MVVSLVTRIGGNLSDRSCHSSSEFREFCSPESFFFLSVANRRHFCWPPHVCKVHTHENARNCLPRFRVSAARLSDRVTMADVSPKQDGGIVKEVVREGEGDVRPGTGDKVPVQEGVLWEGCAVLWDGIWRNVETCREVMGCEVVSGARQEGVLLWNNGVVGRCTCRR